MTASTGYYIVVVGGAAACALPFRVPHLAQSAEAGSAHGDLCVFGPSKTVLFLVEAPG